MRPGGRPHSGFARLWYAFGYSLAGLAAAWRFEAAFRQEVAAACIAIPLAFFVTAEPIGRALLIASVLLVLVVELANSAVEAAVDRASPDVHPLAKRAKDLASAAVLVALVNAAVVWLVVLLG